MTCQSRLLTRRWPSAVETLFGQTCVSFNSEDRAMTSIAIAQRNFDCASPRLRASQRGMRNECNFGIVCK
jgi:hypothetical protein